MGSGPSISTTLTATSIGTTVINLEEETAYEFRLTATNTSGSASADTSSTTDPEAIKPPANFESSEQTSNTVRLTWNIQSNLISYKLEYKEFGTESWATATTLTPLDENSTEATVSNLAANKTYEFRLTANGIYPRGSAYSTTTATTDIGTLSSPTLDTVIATSSSTINVVWGEVENANCYEVEYAIDVLFNNIVETSVVPSGTTTDSKTYLDPNTLYYVRVIAIGTGDFRDSAPSTAKSARTFLETPILQSDGTTPTSVALFWNSVNGDDGYEVRYRTGGGGWTTIEVPGTSVTIHNLTTDVEHEFQMRAMATTVNGNHSAWSDSLYETPSKIRSREIPHGQRKMLTLQVI